MVAAVTHTTADSRYAWLNDALGVVAGEVYRRDRVVLEVAELV